MIILIIISNIFRHNIYKVKNATTNSNNNNDNINDTLNEIILYHQH